MNREVSRNGGSDSYRASEADERTWERARRPKSCRLARSPRIRQLVEEKLRQVWLPEQIAGWLKHSYPEDESLHVSHETIYRRLFVQARGVLKKELTQYLRTRRTIRRSGKASRKGHGKGQIEDMISIRERPASVEVSRLKIDNDLCANGFEADGHGTHKDTGHLSGTSMTRFSKAVSFTITCFRSAALFRLSVELRSLMISTSSTSVRNQVGASRYRREQY